MIYLDYAASTPIDPEVADLIAKTSSESFGNPSSVHAVGRKAKILLEDSRDAIARLVGADGSEITFTSGGTEADNLALLGTFSAVTKAQKRHLVICATEHHAVLRSAEYLESLGVEVTRLPVDQHGNADESALRSALRPETVLVSIMHANNEIGTIQDIPRLAAIAHESGALFHSDAVQSFGKVAVDVRSLGVDLCSLSAHKIYGPKGIGALFVRKGVAINPILHGGGQEAGRRPGTENASLAAGFALAAQRAFDTQPETMDRIRLLRNGMRDRLTELFPGLLLNGHPDDVLATILNVSFDDQRYALDGDALIMNMDLQGIAVTSGSACTSGSLVPSHVLAAIGRNAATSRATIRFSFGKQTTGAEIDEAVETLERVVKMMLKR